MSWKSGTRWSGRFAVMAAALLLVGASGCVAVGAGGPLAYMRGDLDATLSVPFESAVRAANLAVTQLEFFKLSEKKDALQAIIVSRNAADKRVEIRMEKVADSATKLKIRVGAFGDETVSMATYVKINSNL